MGKAVLLCLVCTFIYVEGQLQAWHRKDCPLVVDVTKPLTELIARNFNLSTYYIEEKYNMQLHILVRKLVFFQRTNQGFAVIKILSGYSERNYFFVLLENCRIKEKFKTKIVHLELNTSFHSEFFPSLRQAKRAAVKFERNIRYNPAMVNTLPVGNKTNIPKRAKQVAAITGATVGVTVGVGVLALATVFSLGTAPFFLACMAKDIDFPSPSTTPPYHLINRHWGGEWYKDADFDNSEYNGDYFNVKVAVFQGVVQ